MLSKFGDFKIFLYSNGPLESPKTSILLNTISLKVVMQNCDILVRIHSECLTGEGSFGSKRLRDCGEQLIMPYVVVEKEGKRRCGLACAKKVVALV